MYILQVYREKKSKYKMKKEANKRKIDQVQFLILQHKAEKQGKPRKTKRNNDSKNSKLPKKSEKT